MPSDYTSKFSEKYGQLSGADMEILGAREQAATARALRNAFKPAQGQMVGGWYVKPSLTQNLADALMQYNNYKNEQAGTTEAKRLIGERQALSNKADAYLANATPAQPGYQVQVPAVESGATNAKLDELLAGGYGSDAQGQPLFSDAAPTPPAAPIDSNAFNAASQAKSTALLEKSLQMQAQAKADADAAMNGQRPWPVDNAPLANALRHTQLDPVGASINGQTPIPEGQTPIQTGGTSSAPAEQTLPTITTSAPREVPEPAQPNQLAQMLRGEGEYAPVRQAGVMDVPPVPSNFDRMTYVRMLGLANRNQEADREVKNMDAQLVADTARATAQMADLKVQREGILNREQARAIATDRIEDNAKREQQRAQDKKDEAESARAFRKDEKAITDATTRRGQDMNAEVRREIAANKPEKPLTEYQGKSLAYGLRSQDANDVIEKIGTNYSPLAIDAYKKVEGVPGVGTGAYALLSDTDKQVSQAQRNFVNAVLRQESGAVISKEEFVNAQKQYFPQPGDDAATLQQKSDNRKRVISSFKTSAGRTVEGEFARPAPTTAPSAPSYIVNKKTGKTMVSTDGEKTWQEVK